MPTLLFVDEKNVLEWKGIKTAGYQKENKGTLKKGISERGASCLKCNKNYKTQTFSEIHLKDCSVSRKSNVIL